MLNHFVYLLTFFLYLILNIVLFVYQLRSHCSINNVSQDRDHFHYQE